jgi:hypothetical protein
MSKEERLAEFARLRRGILASNDSGEQKERVVELLGEASPWPDLALGVDLALETIEIPDADIRQLLRAVFQRCSEPDAKDTTAIIRTGVIRLLSREPDREDLDLFVGAAETYIIVDQVDVAAEMRALALRAVAEIDSKLARWIAARLLFDCDFIPNQEPNRTAADVLAKHDDHPLLLRWLDAFEGTHPPEAAALAEQDLAQVLPQSIWTARAAERLGDARPVETLGALTGAIKRNDAEMYPEMRSLLLRIKDADLFRAVSLTLATAHDKRVQDIVTGAAADIRDDHLSIYLEALELCRSTGKDAAVKAVRQRMSKRKSS